MEDLNQNQIPDDIELSVNMSIFKLMCVLWVLLTIGMVIPNYTLPAKLDMLYGIITGSILTIFRTFTRQVAKHTDPKGEETNEQS